MPDLTIESFAWCKSNTHWTRQVAGSKGKVYTVVYGQLPRGSQYSHGYSCDCEAFRFGGGKPCKHIKAVEHERCAWNADAVCGSSEPYPPNGKCPKCGGELSGVRVAI